METTALAGMGCLVVVCAAVGVRLLALGLRSGGTPERALAAAYLLFGAVGYPLGAWARARAASGDPHAGLWLAAALAIQNVGIAGVYVFVAGVFRPGRSGRAATAAGALLLAASWLGHGVEPGWAGAASRGGWYFLGLATRAAAFVWAAAEGFAYWARLRRRVALGLADPVVANRMWLWGASSAAIALAFAIFALAGVSRGAANATPVVLALAACGLAGSAAMALAFFPPARYRRWLRARAPQPTGAGGGTSGGSIL